MFQPQSSPYAAAASYSPYGLGPTAADFPGLFPASSTTGVGAGARAGLVVDSGGPTVFENPIFSPVVTAGSSLAGGALSFSTGAHAHTHATTHAFPSRPPQQQQQQPQQQHINMSEHDLDAQERAAQKYEQESRIEGPMVGEKRSSQAITKEYAKADPIYVAKTLALPQTYSHFRPIAGDGNCGWRAAGYSYFEHLVQSQSRSQLEEEIARITSLNNILTTAGGFEQWIAEDLTEETMTLLKDLAEVVEISPMGAADILHVRFNDHNLSLSIIYHLRLLASAWLAANPAEYAGFIPDGLGVVGYRKNCLEATNTEIEHLGMTLLIDVLLKPIGIAVEIVILDRSEGKQVNSHIFQSEDSNGLPTNPGGPMIHLLYRPSHYDILYKDQSPIANQQVIANMDLQSNLQVNRAHNFTEAHHIEGTNMADYSHLDLNSPLLDLPGHSLMYQSSTLPYQAQYQAQLDATYTHSPMSASLSPISPSGSIASTSVTMSPTYSQQQVSNVQPMVTSGTLHHSHNPQAYLSNTTQRPVRQPSMASTTPLVHRPAMTGHQSLPTELSTPVTTSSNFRPSQYNYNAPAEWHEPVICQTSTFKNSHFNTAHYLNPDFQPEEWTPESEEPMMSGRKRSG